MAFGLGVCLPGLAIAAHGRTATCLPARPVVDSLCCGKATVVETAHWAVSKSHLSNPQPPSAKTEKGHSFWNVLLFWWKVVDSNHRSHRRQIYSLEQPRRIPDVFGFVPLLFPCLLVQDYLLEF